MLDALRCVSQGEKMKLLIRAIMLVALIWLAMLHRAARNLSEQMGYHDYPF